ncbi:MULTISPECIES: SGNH/GDSL hydrolase family protein [unclassified Streptomyces]|uniref:SGNH/GDSL hydrolase family protein n=1 Tax=unclassified Streptomyces TaxID=2593676 RepID=UPI0011CAF615|nr:MULTISPECIES: SGNH/GDSL hydrolase family protein [unclassified Streptomyces]TXS12014.1 SGNH/GDSL hydrolase family protein [Streptomyces sp. wa22]WSR52616.1 SGNH/GDSL hydrolase family protein [Streptomyces sp. NBC_01201]
MPNGEYLRYVALGDSQTEGLGDKDDTVGLRGFADRLAEHLAVGGSEVLYANLAVRGRLAGQVRAEQLGPALALRPDLATVVAGVNDALRPRFDAAAVIGHVEEMFAALTQAGAHVVTLTFPDVTKIVPLARPIRPRLLDLNARIRSAAARHGVTVVETGRSAVATDPRLWGADRLHASPLGHERIAAAAARTLGLPGSDDTWSLPLPPRTVPTGRQATGAELRWAAAFLGPWLGRRLRARSSGDGRTSKRPQLLPVIITSPSAEDMGRRELP